MTPADNVLNFFTAMIADIPVHITYWMFGLYFALESAGVPLPNEPILLFAGFLSKNGQYSLYVFIMASILGSMLGVALSYYFGRYLGERHIRKANRPPFLTKEREETIKHWLHNKSLGVFVFIRFTPFIRTYASIFAGVYNINPIRFFIESFIGTAIWCAGFLVIGFFVGEQWDKIISFANKYTDLALILVVFAVSFYIYWHFFRKRND